MPKHSKGEPYVGQAGPVKIGKCIVAPTDPTGGKSVSKSGSFKK